MLITLTPLSYLMIFVDSKGLPNPEAPHDPTKFVNHDLLLGAVRDGAKVRDATH